VRSFLRYHLRNGTLEQSLLLKFKLPKIQRKLPTVARQTQLNDALDNLVPAVQESVLPQSGDQSVQNQIVVYSFAKENPAPQGEWLALRDRVVMEVLYGCGLRCAELVGLTWAHIDWGQQQLRVRGKGNKTRLVPIGQSAQSALLAYRTALAAAGRSAEGPVVQTERGGPPYAKLVYNIVHRFLVESGQPGKASPHVLRHSYASHLLENGADLNAIKDLLGHSSLAATQIYVHTHPGRLKAVHSQAHPRSGK
jgi:integrase/recombinase XerC